MIVESKDEIKVNLEKVKFTKKLEKKIIKKLKKRLWELAKEYCRLKHGNICFTCGKKGLKGGNWHTGHFISKKISCFTVDYNPSNLRPQCYNCNINLGGNGSYFYRNLLEEIGEIYINALFLENEDKVKPSMSDYIDYINMYKGIINEIKMNKK